MMKDENKNDDTKKTEKDVSQICEAHEVIYWMFSIL